MPAFDLDRDLQSTTPRVPRQSHHRPRQAADHRSGRHVRSSPVAQARSDSSGQRAKARNAESGAAHRAPEQPVTRAVTQPVIETWQARENYVAGVSIDQFPSHRITRIGLDSRAQVRRLLGMRIVARCTRGLAKLSVATMAFGDAQRFPQDRVRTPAHDRAWPMGRARTSNFFVLRFA
jgi:hypothetical protein